MQGKRLFSITLFLLIISLVSISANEDLIIGIKSDHGTNPISLNLNHGYSESIKFTVSNNQYSCSLDCNWKLHDTSNNKLVKSGNEIVEAKELFYKTLLFNAPTKSEAGQDSGTVEYRFNIKCEEIKTLVWCNGDGKDDENYKITLNYDLTEQEKKWRDESKSKLDSIEKELKSIEEKDANINEKINNQPDNLLIEDINKRISSLENRYGDYKEKYDNSKNQWENLEYKNSINTLDKLDPNYGEDIINKYDKLKKDLDAKIKVHNEVVKKLNQLSNKISELENIEELIKDNNVNHLINNFDSLKRDFEKGNFESYNQIRDRINILSDEANSIKKESDKKIEDIINKGVDLLNKEKEKTTLTITGLSINNRDYSNIDSICNNFESLRQNIIEDNDKRLKEHNKRFNEVSEYNSKAKKINLRVERINNISQNVYHLVNERGIDSVNYSKCKSELLRFKENINNEGVNFDLDGLNESLCEETIKKSEEIESNRNISFLLSLKLFFKNIFNWGYVDFPETGNIILKEKPEKPRLEKISEESRDYLEEICSIKLNRSKSVNFEEANIDDYQADYNSEVENVQENKNMCCVFGQCEPCCEGDSCLNDEDSFPVIFLHGHAPDAEDSPEYSLDAFNPFQEELIKEGFRHGGMILPNTPKSDYGKGDLGKVRVPITFKSTYYYNVYDSEGNIINEPSKQESIDTYSQRLNDVVDIVKDRTNRNKVNIVAHSMGGLVARNYIKNHGGDSKVNKLIMIGTPNHGIYGSVDFLCEVVGGANTECAQMRADSGFIESLNSGDETQGNVEYYTIAGSGCELGGGDGDGISTLNSVQLEGARNVVINGECEWSNGIVPTKRAFHSNLLKPNLHPETLDYVLDFLKE